MEEEYNIVQFAIDSLPDAMKTFTFLQKEMADCANILDFSLSDMLKYLVRLLFITQTASFKNMKAAYIK